MLWNEDQLPRVKNENKPKLKGKWESVFSGKHMDNFPKGTHVVSVMNQHQVRGGQRSQTKRLSSSPASNSKAKQTDVKGQKSSTEALTASGEVHTHEEAQVFVMT